MAAEFPHFSAFRPVTSAAAAAAAAAHASATLAESSAATAAETATETGCAEVSTTVDKVENDELPTAVADADDCGEKGNGV